jgi:hypothetical protein
MQFSPATVAAFDRLDRARARVEAADDEHIAAWEEARSTGNPNLPRYQAALAESDAANVEMRAAVDAAQAAYDAEIRAALVARFGPNGPSTWEDFQRGAQETGGFGAGMVTSLPGAIKDNVVGTVTGVWDFAKTAVTSPGTIANAFRGPDDPAAAAAASRASSRRELEQSLADRLAAIDDPVGVGAKDGARFSNVVVAPMVVGAVGGEIVGAGAELLGGEGAAVDVAAGCATCGAVDGNVAAAAASATADGADAIAAKSLPFRGDPGGKLGGGMIKSGMVTVDRSGNVVSSTLRYVRTADITADDLGYPGGLRDAQPVNLDDIPTAPVKQVLDVTPVSDSTSGSAGLVRVGELADGRPVALKTYYSTRGPEYDAARIAEEARSAKLYSDLGIGPKFHGTFVDAQGTTNIVMDVARGDFPEVASQNINRQSFSDLETMLGRLNDAGIKRLGDGFQPLIDSDGRLQAIDSNGVTDQLGRPTADDPNGPTGDFTYQRREMILYADPKVSGQYLADLRQSNPPAYKSLAEYYASRGEQMPPH